MMAVLSAIGGVATVLSVAYVVVLGAMLTRCRADRAEPESPADDERVYAVRLDGGLIVFGRDRADLERNLRRYARHYQNH